MESDVLNVPEIGSETEVNRRFNEIVTAYEASADDIREQLSEGTEGTKKGGPSDGPGFGSNDW